MRKVFVEMDKLKNLASGLGQFCLNIGLEYQQIAPEDLLLNFYVSRSQRNIFGHRFNYRDQNFLHKLLPIKGVEYDVWHCIHQDSHYLPRNSKTKFILTIHDLNFLQKYSADKCQNKLKKLQEKINRADAITVISNYTEQEVRKNLNVKPPVYVIHNGSCLRESQVSPTIDIASFGDYFFSTGIVSEKKNFHVLLPLIEHFDKMHLVIAGNSKTDYARYIIDLAKQKKIADRLHFTGVVDENNKYHLYKHCTAFVFPSLLEGFGLPVVEAMSMGKPTFISDRSSLPEVGGKEAYYWKNFEPANMVDIVSLGLSDHKKDAAKKKRTMGWADQYSWRNAALKYLELYKIVI